MDHLTTSVYGKLVPALLKRHELLLQSFWLIIYYGMSSKDFQIPIVFFLLMREMFELAGVSGNEKVLRESKIN